MKRWLLQILVFSGILAGGWWTWRIFYSGNQFIAAMQARDYAKAEKLMALGGESYGTSQLHLSIRRGNIAKTRSLLVAGYDPNKEGWHSPPMILSIICHKYDPASMIKLLLSHGGDVNIRSDGYNRTPLQWAAYYGQEDVVKLLLQNGATVNTQDCFGQTPLCWAVKMGSFNNPKKRLPIVRILLNHGANPNISTTRTTLHGLNNEILRPPAGTTPLHLTALERDIELAELLVAAGATSDCKDAENKTAIDIWPELAEIVKEVEKAKAESNP